MTDKKKDDIIVEVEAPEVETEFPEPNTMEAILQGMLSMQQKTNETLEKMSERIDNIEKVKEELKPKTEDEMYQELRDAPKTTERKMYKVMVIKSVLPMDSVDSQLHGDMFSNAGIVWGDTNKWFDSEQEANDYGNEIAPGKFKLLPVTVPIPEGEEYKVRRPNITM